MTIRRILLIAIAVVSIMGIGTFASARTGEEGSLKAIRGIRKTSVNKEGISKKAQVKKRIKKEKQRVIAAKNAVNTAKVQLLEYQKIKEATNTTGTVFAANGQGTGLFNGAAVFDAYFRRIADYGNVNENAILVNGYLSPEFGENKIPYLENLAPDQMNTVTLLQSEDTEAVDISTYLSYAIYQKREQIASYRKNLKKERKKLQALRNKAKRIVTRRIVFNANDITEVSNITKNKMKEILKGTKLEKYAGVYVDIEKKYGINAIAFCALSAFESGWGESHRARVDHNYTGFGVYSDSSVGINASSGKANLYMTARHLAKHYLHRGDTYYHGRGLDGLNRSYSTAGVWAYEIEKIGARLMGRL